jgi:hypothetical protein
VDRCPWISGISLWSSINGSQQLHAFQKGLYLYIVFILYWTHCHRRLTISTKGLKIQPRKNQLRLRVKMQPLLHQVKTSYSILTKTYNFRNCHMEEQSLIWFLDRRYKSLTSSWWLHKIEMWKWNAFQSLQQSLVRFSIEQNLIILAWDTNMIFFLKGNCFQSMVWWRCEV